MVTLSEFGTFNGNISALNLKNLKYIGWLNNLQASEKCELLFERDLPLFNKHQEKLGLIYFIAFNLFFSHGTESSAERYLFYCR